jgi:hypothetical protein
LATIPWIILMADDDARGDLRHVHGRHADLGAVGVVRAVAGAVGRDEEVVGAGVPVGGVATTSAVAH